MSQDKLNETITDCHSCIFPSVQ